MKFDYKALLGISMVAGLLLYPAVPVQAADNGASSKKADSTATAKTEDTGLSANLSRLQKSNTDKETAKPAVNDGKANEKDRYLTILRDNGFVYALDTRNAHWIPMPHSGNEYIADVWVKLVQTEGDVNYSYPQKYYLEHYYIRPKTQQIQFLCELEVTGRPENAVQERPYKSSNWENLVPDSIEDEIYHKVLQAMKKNRIGGDSSNGMSIRDAVEEYLRISL